MHVCMSANIYDLKIKLFIFFVIFTDCGVSQVVFFSLVVFQSDFNARCFKMEIQKRIFFVFFIIIYDLFLSKYVYFRQNRSREIF